MRTNTKSDRNWRPLVNLTMVTLLCAFALLITGCRTANSLVPPEVKAEKEYKQRLSVWLNDALPPEARYSAQLFLSQRAINQVLDGLVDAEIPLSTSQATKFRIRTVQTLFREGFPMVRVAGKVYSPTSNWSAEADAYALLEAIDEEQMKTPAMLEFRLRFYLLDEASVRYSVVSLPLKGIIREIAQKKLIELTDAIAPFALPCAENWNFKVPNAPDVLKINAPGGGSVTIDFDRKLESVRANLRVARVVFLNDGLHLFGNFSLQLGSKVIEVKPTGKLSATYASLSPEQKSQRLLCTNYSFRIGVSQGAVRQCNDLLRETDEAFRTIAFHSIGQKIPIVVSGIKASLKTKTSAAGKVIAGKPIFHSDEELGSIEIPLQGTAKAELKAKKKIKKWYGFLVRMVSDETVDVKGHGRLSQDSSITIAPVLKSPNVIFTAKSAKGAFNLVANLDGTWIEDIGLNLTGHDQENDSIKLNKELAGKELFKVEVPDIFAKKGKLKVGGQTRSYSIVVASTALFVQDSSLVSAGQATIRYAP